MTTGPAEGYPAAIKRVGHVQARSIYQLTVENRDCLRELIAIEEIVCDYREPGNLSLALGSEQFEAAARSVESISGDGFAAQLLDRETAQAVVGTALGPEVSGGIYIPETGLLHSARLVYGLLAAAQRLGARLVQTTVTAITEEDAAVAIQTSTGILRAGATIVAANAWTGDLLPSLARFVVPVRGQMLAYAPIDPVFSPGMGAELSSTGEYWQQTPDGTIVLGGCRAYAAGKDVGMREARPTPEVQSALEQVLPRLFPDLRGLHVARRWAGLMAFTPDYLPIAGRVPEVTNIWVGGGFCGHGMPFAIRVGQLLAQAVLDGRTPEALMPLRPDRPTLQSLADAR
jgi:glycine/D-amino acid oxidase-like deaminating enzyme